MVIPTPTSEFFPEQPLCLCASLVNHCSGKVHHRGTETQRLLRENPRLGHDPKSTSVDNDLERRLLFR